MRVFQVEGDWGMNSLKLSQRAEPQAGLGQVLVRMKGYGGVAFLARHDSLTVCEIQVMLPRA